TIRIALMGLSHPLAKLSCLVDSLPVFQSRRECVDASILVNRMPGGASHWVINHRINCCVSIADSVKLTQEFPAYHSFRNPGGVIRFEIGECDVGKIAPPLLIFNLDVARRGTRTHVEPGAISNHSIAHECRRAH